MAICNNKKIVNIILNIFFLFFFVNSSYTEVNFKKLEKKEISYIDFFLLKFENELTKRSQFLKSQLFATRVQYSTIGIEVFFDSKKEKIFTNIYAVMDENRYKKKKYKQKIRDCNQVRNLIFYKESGYKFFTQKRDPTLSKELMEDIFKRAFFSNLSFNEKETEYLLDNMFVKVTIYHPIYKRELVCSGKVNNYELN